MRQVIIVNVLGLCFGKLVKSKPIFDILNDEQFCCKKVRQKGLS